MTTTPANPYLAANTAAHAACIALGLRVLDAQRYAESIANTLNQMTADGFDDTDPFELYYLVRRTLPSTSESAIRAACIAWASFKRQPMGDGTYQ